MSKMAAGIEGKSVFIRAEGWSWLRVSDLQLMGSNKIRPQLDTKLPRCPVLFRSMSGKTFEDKGLTKK